MKELCWEYASSLSKRTERIGQLSSPSSFLSIVDRVAREGVIQCVHEQPAINMVGHWRPVYCVAIGQPLFDLFFNSAHGYRAAYFISAEDGRKADRTMIQRLLPQLLADASNTTFNIDPRKSLEAWSAKVWLAEVGKGLNVTPGKPCLDCCGEWRPPQDAVPEIHNGRWEVVKDKPYRNYGRKAPYLTKLRIFGAFIDMEGNEWVPEDKVLRAEQLYELGWS